MILLDVRLLAKLVMKVHKERHSSKVGKFGGKVSSGNAMLSRSVWLERCLVGSQALGV